MKISDIFDQLTFGELKQIDVGGYEEGEVQPSKYKELVNHINIALLQLYTRFPIDEKEFLLTPIAGQTFYNIEPDASYLTGVHADGTTTFDNDILRINAVFNQTGSELPLNDEFSEDSVFLPTFKQIQIPLDRADTYSFIYRAKPAKLVAPVYVFESTPEDYTDFLDTDVFLPEVLLEPLLAYVEQRVQKAKGGEAGLQQASIASQQFEILCEGVEKRNVLNNANNSTNIKLTLGGWR